MQKTSFKTSVALGSLTAAVALLAGLGTASAQIRAPAAPATAPTGAAGSGSFPQSFLIPGTNTSLSIYGIVRAIITDQLGSQHSGDTQTTGAQPFFGGFSIGLQGPGIGGANSNNLAASQHGGLRAWGKSSTFTFETRTPSDLGEIKTVIAADFGLFSNQSNYLSVTTSTNSPSAGIGNTDAMRLLWAYGTIGPWLIGQYNTNFQDPLLFPDITNPQFLPGMVGTSNIRQPQIRYTYLAGNGITATASLEYYESGTKYIASNGTTSSLVSSFVSDNTDTGGVINLPDFNTGIAWDQPWGHLSAHVGVARNEIRNTLSGTSIFGASNGANNIKKWGWAITGGGYLNTWGQDQWKFQVTYDKGVSNFDSDLSPNSAGNMFCDGRLGSCDLIRDFNWNTSYIHRFNPFWRSTAAIGMGFFNKPASAALLTNTPTSQTGTAQLTALEKRHLFSELNVVYSPVPGLTDIYLAWDHYERWVQATDTTGRGNTFVAGFSFYW